MADEEAPLPPVEIPWKLAATFDSSFGNEAGETDAVTLMKTTCSSGKAPVSVASSGWKKNNDSAV